MIAFGITSRREVAKTSRPPQTTLRHEHSINVDNKGIVPTLLPGLSRSPPARATGLGVFRKKINSLRAAEKFMAVPGRRASNSEGL